MNYRLLMAALCCSVAAVSAPAYAQQATSAPSDMANRSLPSGDIVVTARKRAERLISAPVTITSLSAAQVSQYRTDDLIRLSDVTPGVVVGVTRTAAGGTISIRGVSTSPAQAGLEQAVSVSMDGVQTSDGRISQIGFFDVERIEILKGPQALFFGKNSPAGVISIVTAGPTSELQVNGRASYEFVGDEVTSDLAVSGPLTETLGFRLAGRYRHLDGWLRNTAQPIANPFYNPATGAPASLASIPGAGDPRPGSSEAGLRLTLLYQPSPSFSASLKMTGIRNRDSGNAISLQSIGPCVGGRVSIYGVLDPVAECVPDNRVTNADLSPAASQTFPFGNRSGKAFGSVDGLTSALALHGEVDQIQLDATTGFNILKIKSQQGNDQSSFSQASAFQDDEVREFSQEARLLTDFEGAFNAMLGVYYQHTVSNVHQDASLMLGQYSAAAGRYDAFEKVAKGTGDAFSIFGQAIIRPVEQIEINAGGRFSSERKTYDAQALYGFGVFNAVNTFYQGGGRPGQLLGKYKDTNFSPEATVTWRPDANNTLYGSYKTGYKSGAFGLSSPLTIATTIADVDVGEERVRGLEMGYKALLLDGRLRLTTALFDYTFKDLQVITYNPSTVSFILDNAGKLRQRGAEVDAKWQVSDILSLHGAVTYAHNRFEDYVGQCYGYTFAPGATRATAVAPPNCAFATATTLALAQDFDGRAPARSPDWSGAAGFDSAFPMAGGVLRISGDAIYTSRFYASETMSPSTLQPGFWKFNGRIAFGPESELWEVALVGRNLTNKYTLLYATDKSGGAIPTGGYTQQRAAVSRGREVMLQLSANF